VSFESNDHTAALRGFLEDADGPIAIASSDDADGLAAAALIYRVLVREGYRVELPLVAPIAARAFDGEPRRTLAARRPAGVIWVDLGVSRRGEIEGSECLFIDDHRPEPGPPPARVMSTGCCRFMVVLL
jgi:single-stranded DNA-specific DHH superfamily exonuclease